MFDWRDNDLPQLHHDMRLGTERAFLIILSIIIDIKNNSNDLKKKLH